MQTIHLERRLSHRYVDTYDHLDEWQDIGTAKLTPPKLVREGNSYDEGGTYLRWATIPRGQNLKLSAAALADSLTRVGCHHEWDCCGCESVRTRVLHRKGRRFVLVTTVGYNY